jgi:hypothetical protein
MIIEENLKSLKNIKFSDMEGLLAHVPPEKKKKKESKK